MHGGIGNGIRRWRDGTGERGTFSRPGSGMLAATLGSAVGLGNIWKVPALTGQHGGASFLLIYVLSTMLVALPLMIVEMIMGRRTRANAYRTFTLLTPRRAWWVTGALSVLAAALILAFYSDVAGWVFAYVPKALSGGVATTDRWWRPAFSESCWQARGKACSGSGWCWVSSRP